MNTNPKLPNPEEMTMASEAGHTKLEDEFGEQGTMASEAGTSNAPVVTPAPKPMQQTMASLPGTSSNTGAGKVSTKLSEFTAESLIGTELNSYKVIKKIAEGGMGVVLLGEHTMIGRRGAIKVLKPEFCQDESVVQRFYQEARAVNTIQHENIVDVYDFGRMDNGGVYFLMEFLEGEPLSSKVEKGPLTFAESLPILEQTLRALKAAHDKGFIHRDLKPDNIFLMKRDGTPHVKILDFGIAKLAGLESAQEKLTRTGSIIGTPHYMSPEQIEGSEVDIRTDIYAMGVIMYELWTGDTPFKGETLGQVIKGHLMVQAPRLENLKPDLRIPGRAAEIVAKSLEKDRDKRYANAAELLADLQAAAKLPFTPIETRAPNEEKKSIVVVRNQPTRQPSESIKVDTTLAPPPPPKSSYAIPAVIGIGAAAALAGVLAFSGDATPVTEPNKDKDRVTITDPPKPPEPPKECPEDLDKCSWPNIRREGWAMLRNSINEADPKVRTLGIESLGDLKDTQSTEALLGKVETDSDEEAKAQAAKALGEIGDVSVLAKLEAFTKTASEPLKTWVFGSAAKLGSTTAIKALGKTLTDAMARINTAAKANKPVSTTDAAIALEAGLALAELAKQGDAKTIALLGKLAALEPQLTVYNPTAGALIIGKMALLGDTTARSSLEQFLSNEDESIRLIAAEQLANLGDDGGKAVLTTALTSAQPANQLIAARILVTLGDYSGYDTLLEGIKKYEKDPELQQIAIEGLQRIGERDSLRLIIPQTYEEINWMVKIPAAVAVLTISGLEPAVLTQASVDWVNASLKSGDVTARKAAANIIGELPKAQAKVLFAAAVATPDPDPEVRKAIFKSGGNITNTPEVTNAMVAAVTTEKDAGVREEGVKALGNTKDAGAIEPLKTIFLPDPGRVGVFAAGSLAELGDPDGKAALEVAFANPKLKSVAIEAAIESENKDIISLLTPLSADKDVNVRFLAAESVAGYSPSASTITAIQPVLEEGVTSKDPSVQARAITALAKIGVEKKGTMSIDDYLASPKVETRKASLPLIEAAGAKEGIRYTRLILADQDVELRAQVLPVLESYVGPSRENLDAVISMLKIASEDTDAGVRNQAQLLMVKLDPSGKIITSPIKKKSCGDNKVEAPEVCDDGNGNNGDGCSNKCLVEPPAELPKAACGNGIVESGEECDGGVDCDTSCRTVVPSVAPADTCGDGAVTGTEECDDSNTAAGDGCDTSCKKELAAAFLGSSADALNKIKDASTKITELSIKADDELAKKEADNDALKQVKVDLQTQSDTITEQLKTVAAAEATAKAAGSTSAGVTATLTNVGEARKAAKTAQADAKKQLKQISDAFEEEATSIKASISSAINDTDIKKLQKRINQLKKLATEKDEKQIIDMLQNKLDEKEKELSQ
jgi:cysteine-rich repeat protein